MNLFKSIFSKLFNSSNCVSLIKILLTVKTVSRPLITVSKNLFLSDMDEFYFQITYGITSKKVWSQRRNPLLTNWSNSTFDEVIIFDVLTIFDFRRSAIRRSDSLSPWTEYILIYARFNLNSKQYSFICLYNIFQARIWSENDYFTNQTDKQLKILTKFIWVLKIFFFYVLYCLKLQKCAFLLQTLINYN